MAVINGKKNQYGVINQKIREMKKFYILLVTLFVLVSSCQRSQFATTTRHTQNGRVSYVNNYNKERSKTSKTKSPESHVKGADNQNSSPAPAKTGMENLAEPEITKINPSPISDDDNVIASTSNETTVIAMTENRKLFNIYTSSDTIKSNVPNKGLILDNSIEQVIRFKNGHKEKVNIRSKSNDTLFYTLIDEPNIVRGIIMEQIDTIYQVISNSSKEKDVNARKNERLGIVGLIFSILGWVPVLGIPFALLSIIFLSVSFGKINRHPEKYKGKEIPVTGLIIWLIGLIGYLILIFAGAFAI